VVAEAIAVVICPSPGSLDFPFLVVFPVTWMVDSGVLLVVFPVTELPLLIGLLRHDPHVIELMR